MEEYELQIIFHYFGTLLDSTITWVVGNPVSDITLCHTDFVLVIFSEISQPIWIMIIILKILRDEFVMMRVLFTNNWWFMFVNIKCKVYWKIQMRDRTRSSWTVQITFFLKFVQLCDMLNRFVKKYFNILPLWPQKIFYLINCNICNRWKIAFPVGHEK